MRPFANGFGVLRDRRYRRFLAAAISYSIGLWSFQTLIVWTILEQTNSAQAVSLLTRSLANVHARYDLGITHLKRPLPCLGLCRRLTDGAAVPEESGFG